VEDLAQLIKKAFFIASTGRPGPVVIDIPKDVTAQSIEYEYPASVEMRSYAPVSRGHPKQISRAADLLLGADKPIIYSGGGIIQGDAADELTQLVRELEFPCTNTLMGLGGFPYKDPLFLGMLGMHGTYEANMAMYDCDVMLAVGARFDDRVTGDLAKFSPNSTIIHVDVDPSSIGKNVSVEVPIVGEAAPVLREMLSVVKARKADGVVPDIGQWWDKIEEWRAFKSFEYDRQSAELKPQFVIETLHGITNGNAFVTSDVGQHQMWAAQHYGFSTSRRWINSGGLGTMGFGLPAAIGVQLAHPNEQVACITGEASIMMCIQELSTCKQYDLPVKVINLNNRYMGMVRQWQEFFYEKRYAMSYMDALPDFVKLSESYGHLGILVENEADLKPALVEAFEQKDRTVFLDVITDPNENVFPMIPAGGAHCDMLLAGRDDMVSKDETDLNAV
jgi:acetolactate synthase-1/2/3 large subunit